MQSFYYDVKKYTDYSEIIRKCSKGELKFHEKNTKMFHFSGTILLTQNRFKKKYMELMMKKKPALL